MAYALKVFKMFTRSAAILAHALLLMIALTLTACQKKCQVATQVLTTFVDQEFRLVETSNPQFRDLSNVNFITMAFRINFSGTVFKVENNDKLNQPALTFKYDVDVDSKRFIVQYYQSQAGEQGQEPTESPVGSPVTYQYTIGRELNLIEEGTGYRYRFVQFQGVVRPDEKCTF